MDGEYRCPLQRGPGWEPLLLGKVRRAVFDRPRLSRGVRIQRSVMKFGIDTSQHQLTWPELLQRVQWAEDMGFDSAWVFDHFKALYGDPSGPCFEGWSLLAALGAST